VAPFGVYSGRATGRRGSDGRACYGGPKWPRRAENVGSQSR